MKTIIFILMFMICFATLQSADAARITADIKPQSPESKFTATYQITVPIEYNDGGKIKDMLRDSNWMIQKAADDTDTGSMELAKKLNQKISENDSNAQVSELAVEYLATLSGKSSAASINYKIVLTGTLSGYTIESTSVSPELTLIDMHWRGLSIDVPVIIDGYDINMPISAIAQQEPELYSLLQQHPKAVEMLSENIINADSIMQIPMIDWHFLFDPSGMAGTGRTEYYLDSARSQNSHAVKDSVFESFKEDTDYKIGIIWPADSANIRIAGFAVIDKLEGVEILGVTNSPPEGFAVTSTGDVSLLATYGLPMAIIVAASVIGYFLFKKGTTFF